MYPERLEATTAPVVPLYARLKPARPTPAPAHATSAATQGRNNWFLYLFLFLLPLQNVQTGYLPNLGMGINFLNVMTLLSLVGAIRCGGKVTRGHGVNGWLIVYAIWSLVTLYIGYATVSSDTGIHANTLKDHLTGLFLLFLVQWSVTDWRAWKRVLLVTLLPLPYIAKVAFVQHRSVGEYHYSDDLRIQGTFSQLGANEFAAFCITVSLVVLGLLLATRTDRKWKVLLLGALACALVGVVYAYSRAGYIAIILGTLVIVALWKHRLRAILPALVLAFAIPFVMPESVKERFQSTTLDAGERDASTESRFEFWGVAWKIFGEHPIAGSGYHTFHHKEINSFGMDAHNFFMRELTEKGVVGFGIVVALMWAVLRAARRTLKRHPPGSFAHGLALGMVGAWFALVAGSCFGDRFTYYPMIAYFWAYTGLLLAALRLAPEGARPDERAAHAH